MSFKNITKNKISVFVFGYKENIGTIFCSFRLTINDHEVKPAYVGNQDPVSILINIMLLDTDTIIVHLSSYAMIPI